MDKVTDKLKKLKIIESVVILQLLIIVALILVWSPLGKSVDTHKKQASTNEKSVEQRDIFDAIDATRTNFAAIGTTKRVAPAGNRITNTKLATIIAAENQTYTNNNRLFVTGDNGIFEIIPVASNSAKVVQRLQKQNCAFGGIVEASGFLYANCYGNGTSYIYASAVSAVPSFKKIYTLKGTLLANGLTVDNSGRLYVASTFIGEILRLTPSTKDPYIITRTEIWLKGAGLLTNGIKYANGSIYWTDGALVKRVSIKANGSPEGQKTIFGALAFFDDLTVNSSEILVADYIGGAIRRYNINGQSTGTFGTGLSGPSSVARARAPFPTGSLLVTERSSNQVSLITP